MSSDRVGCCSEQRAYRLDAGRNVGEPQRDRLMLDQDTPALNVVLRIVRSDFKATHADAEIFRRLDDFPGAEIDAGLAERVVLHQQMVLRHTHVLEHEFAVVHIAATQRLVATRDGQPRRFARHEK